MPAKVTVRDGRPVWSDLMLTNYPWYLDNRQVTGDEGSIDPLTGNPQFKLNINFEERKRTTKVKDYFVMAEDINALQDSVIGIQRTLGLVPYGIRGANDVAHRLDMLEGFVVMARSIDEDGFDDLDKRYMWGGSWPFNPDNPQQKALPISIKTHRHTGTYQGAQKINLKSEVTDLLSKLNLDLGSGTSAMLVGTDIYTTIAKTDTVTSAIDKKYNKTGGTISGNVDILGDFRCLTMAEIDLGMLPDVPGSVGSKVQDYKAYSGVSKAAISSNSPGILSLVKLPLRYGKYVAGIRARVSSNTSSTPILKVIIKEGNNIHTSDVLRPNDFVSTGYQMFYIEFEHENKLGTIGKKDLTIEIDFYNGISNVNIDSIVIQPVTTAVYDDDSFLI